jgi:ABC-2 type transport system ATP-binding protein
MVRILCGALKPTEGRVLVKGIDVTKEPTRVKSLIGYLPEEPNLYERLTPQKLLAYFADLHGVTDPDIGGLLDMVGLLDRSDSKIATFSKGMRQRLAIARTLLNDPSILILDEPTMGLDPATARTVREFIASHKEQRTILMCTHYLPEAEALCDRMGIMSGGRFAAQGSIQELKDATGKGDADLEDVFVHFVR